MNENTTTVVLASLLLAELYASGSGPTAAALLPLLDQLVTEHESNSHRRRQA